jgi:hypothetical protein
MTDTLQTALHYAEQGWRIVPITPGEKRPAIQNWTENATNNPEQIRQWWQQNPNYGVGLATGPQSGVFAIDIDVTETKNGYDTLTDLEDQHGPLAETLTNLTPSGGMHLIYQWPDGHNIKNDAGRKLGPGIDVRGEGGQILIYPSQHPNGGIYQFDAGQPETPQPAPEWLIELLTPEPPKPATPTQNVSQEDTESPAARYVKETNWPDLLTADGWQLAFIDQRTGEHHWTRPGKTEGTSATTHYNDTDALVVFTTSLEWLPPGAYSRFGYYACRYHNGNRSEAASQLAQKYGQQTEQWFADQTFTGQLAGHFNNQNGYNPITGNENAGHLAGQNRIELAHLVEWSKLWTDDRPEVEWIAEPVLPAKRSVSIYAPAKAGKSTITLAICAAVATGGYVLGQHKATPTDVLYLDYEMTEDDLIERLSSLGYGPQDDLQRLHYALLPSLPPLDTAEGAQALLALVDHTNAKLVVVDTFGRAVEGDEDKADTVRNFYRHTGLALKARDIAVLRTDHTGKDTKKGQRGSSAKNDDLDVVWQLTRSQTRNGDGLTLTRTHSRVSWVPEQIKIQRVETDHGHDYRADLQSETWPDGTRQDADLLDHLQIPLDASQREAAQTVRDSGHAIGSGRLRTALRFRKAAARIQDQKRLEAGITNRIRPQQPPAEPTVNNDHDLLL